MSRRRPSRRRLARGGIAIAILLGAGLYLQQQGLENADKLASVLSLLVAVGTLLWAPASRAEPRSRIFLADAAVALDELADRNLAATIERDWLRLGLHDPAPLPVGWTNDDALADHWRNICSSGGATEPLALDGVWDDLVDVVERIPSHRLVMVGDGGLGKTVLCLHLARQLLGRRRSGDPVPIVLALSGWDPDAVALDDWVADRLPVDVSAGLADDAGDGRTIARAMLDDGHVVLLLDGLDELPSTMHRAAVTRINQARPRPLLLTSRRTEYTAATVHERLAGAAVVRVAPVAAPDVAAWLERSAPPTGPGTSKWTAVLADSTPLGDALTLPLFAGLARSVYSRTDADPAELAVRAEAGPDKVAELLLDRMVPSAYGAGTPLSADRWAPAVAQHYLTTLGRAMAAHDVDRLEWWRLDRALPRLRARLAKAATVTMIFVALNVASGVVVSAKSSPAAILIVAGVALAVFVADPASAARAPVAQRLGPPRDARRALGTLGRALLRGATAGGAVGGVVVVSLVLGSIDLGTWLDQWALFLLVLLIGMLTFGSLGAGMAIVVSIPLAVLDLISRPLALDRIPDPGTAVRVDRRWSLVRAALFGTAVGNTLIAALYLLLGVALDLISLANDLPAPPRADVALWPPDLRATLVIGVTAAVGMLLTHTVWGRFLFARLYLAAHRRAPWRLMTFLDDARDRGLLRQVGAAYAFRHEQLRARLARDPEPSLDPPVPVT